MPEYVRHGIFLHMAVSVKDSERHRSREGQVRKVLWLNPETLRRAQAILGTATERETVEMALDVIVFRQEIFDGIQVLSGLRFDPIGDPQLRLKDARPLHL